jgi:hypothetical protein
LVQPVAKVVVEPSGVTRRIVPVVGEPLAALLQRNIFPPLSKARPRGLLTSGRKVLWTALGVYR